MVRILLGIIVGFITWSILWVGSDQLIILMSPGWYGAHQHGLEDAFMNQMPFAVDSTILIMHLVREVIITLIAGFIAALVARENSRSTLGLGILLLLVGILVEATAWNYLPIWYHLVFLVLLIPVTISGGKLRKTV